MIHQKKETKNKNDGLKNLRLECLVVIHNSFKPKPIPPFLLFVGYFLNRKCFYHTLIFT